MPTRHREADNTRYVRKAANGKWEVRKDGHLRATVHTRTKTDALKAARAAVREEGGGEVLVMNRTGKVVEDVTVPRLRRQAAA
jgi:hypothetical protein